MMVGMEKPATMSELNRPPKGCRLSELEDTHHLTRDDLAAVLGLASGRSLTHAFRTKLGPVPTHCTIMDRRPRPIYLGRDVKEWAAARNAVSTTTIWAARRTFRAWLGICPTQGRVKHWQWECLDCGAAHCLHSTSADAAVSAFAEAEHHRSMCKPPTPTTPE